MEEHAPEEIPRANEQGGTTDGWRVGASFGLERLPWQRDDWKWLLGLMLIGFVGLQGPMPLITMPRDFVASDGVINAFLLGWVADTWWHAPHRLFDAPIFYPASNALVNMDCMILPGIIMTPVWLLTRNFALTMNLGMLVALWFMLGTVYIMLRRMTSIPQPLAAMGAVYASMHTDFWWHTLGHINLVWTFVLPCAFWAGWLIMMDRRWYTVVVTALAGLAALWCSFYLLVFATFCGLCGLLAPVFVLWRRPARGWWLRLIAAAALGVALMMPTLLPYMSRSGDLLTRRGGYGENLWYAGTFKGFFLPPYQPTDYIAPVSNIAVSALGLDPKQLWTVGEDAQFLGFGLMLLLFWEFGRLILKRTRGGGWEPLDRFSVFTFGAGFVAFALALGLYWGPRIPGPYMFVSEYILSHLRFFRVPCRFSTAVLFFAALPAAVFLTATLAHRKNAMLTACFCLTALVIFEHWPAKYKDRFSLTGKAPVLEALNLKEPTITDPVITIPHINNLLVSQLAQSEGKWRPAVNGWLHSPVERWHDDLMLAVNDFPSVRAKGILATMEPVPWVLIVKPAMVLEAKADSGVRVSEFDDTAMALAEIVDPEQALAEWATLKATTRKDVQKLRAALPAWGDAVVLFDASDNKPDKYDTLGFAAEVIEGDGIKLVPTDDYYPRFYAEIPSAFPLRAFDILELTIYSERNLDGEPLELHWVKPGSNIMAWRSRISVFEPAGENLWRISFPMYMHPDWYFDENPLDQICLVFNDFDTVSQTPVVIKSLVAHQLVEPAIPDIEGMIPPQPESD